MRHQQGSGAGSPGAVAPMGSGYGRGPHGHSPDPVDAYLGRYHLHQAIRSAFRASADSHRAALEELEERITSMVRPGSPRREDGQPAGSPPRLRLASARPGSEPLPEPLRNRFAPLPRPGSAASAASPPPGSARGSGGAPPPHSSPTTAAAAAASLAVPPQHSQGAYLALPDGSFAGSAPFKACPSTEGLAFERYSRTEQRADLPDVQRRYLRPPGVCAVKPPLVLKKVPRNQQPPARVLPNGIPNSRLERLSARRRERSPPRYPGPGPPSPPPAPSPRPPPSHEVVTLTGAAAAPPSPPASRPLSPCEPLALLPASSAVMPQRQQHSARSRSPSPTQARSPRAAARAAAAGDADTLAAYLSTSTAPKTGEPLLDEAFYGVLQAHFRASVAAQTAELRSRLNGALPAVLGALNCVNVVEPKGGTGRGGGGAGGMGTAGR